MNSINCTLCDAKTVIYKKYKTKNYYRCPQCEAVLLDPQNFITLSQEKARYEEHNNDVKDPRYKNFVLPIVNQVLTYYQREHLGLDFGAGTGPVISEMLMNEGYNIKQYDPFFWNNQQALDSQYDYIVCCEVIEHFHNPKKEFNLLRDLLKENGSLIMMTDLIDENINFDKWYYKNDQTHVFFYNKKTIDYIIEKFNFKDIKIEGRLIHLIKQA